MAITDEEITKYSYIISSRFEAINTRYIKLMAQQLKKIGTLNPSNIKRLEQMARMNSNIMEINQMLAMESGRTLEELYQVYDMSAMSQYEDLLPLYTARGKVQTPYEENRWMNSYTESVKSLTSGTFQNLSNTTAMFDDYRNLVDVAVDAVSTGVDDYQAVIWQQIEHPSMTGLERNPTYNGLQVRYASGRTRRLDSAVRMNVLEGMRRVNNGIREQAGKEFGADGVEITAHSLCAVDHLDVQGNQYAAGSSEVVVNGVKYEGFDFINAGLQREISTCNCKHSIFPIVLGVSEPTYTKHELIQMKQSSNEKIQYGDKEITRYEASQKMRQLETQIRYAKDKHIFASELGNEKKKLEAENRIDNLKFQYNQLAKKANLTPQLERTYVPGYKWKANPKPDDLTLNI